MNVKNANEITLLLVEDDDIDAMTIKRSFKKQNITNPVTRVYDGIEALALLKDKKVSQPLVIILDLQMPRMGGIEFLQTLRADPLLSDLVVFVLTTSKAKSDIASSYGEHIAGYFVKGETGERFSGLVNMLKNYFEIVHLNEE
ncbi:response regulator [uncultured Psychromonas sp.]|uniref:response regulator n=1 Tax=uncultured Psychromonas sp. TaxID=173974 RepID=UPI0026296E6B|nr:response regulator [uncultured Psychromonas sp.]